MKERKRDPRWDGGGDELHGFSRMSLVFIHTAYIRGRFYIDRCCGFHDCCRFCGYTYRNSPPVSVARAEYSLSDYYV